jgi:hypothetical protein
MKSSVLHGALIVGLVVGLGLVGSSAGTVYAQKPGQGHTAPKAQPASAPAPNAPGGEIALGAIHLSKGVKADGKSLPAGTYQVRVTAETASPNAAGQSQGLERWMEFVQGGKVKGREVVTIIPQSEIAHVQKDAPPAANSSKFEVLKGGDYMRLWIRRGANHYLVHFPA